MARRMDHVRTGQDRVTDYLKKYGNRLNTGAVKGVDSLQHVVDLLEYVAIGEYLADKFTDPQYDEYILPTEHPVTDLLVDQLILHGEVGRTYVGAARRAIFTFREAREIFGADSLASLDAKATEPGGKVSKFIPNIDIDDAIVEGLAKDFSGSMAPARDIDEAVARGQIFEFAWRRERAAALDRLENWGMPYAYVTEPLTLNSDEETVALAPSLVAGNSHDGTVWPKHGYWVYRQHIPDKARLDKVLGDARRGEAPPRAAK